MPDKNSTNQRQKAVVITNDTIREMGDRMDEFSTYVRTLSEKQESGKTLTKKDIEKFKDMVSVLINQDMHMLMGVVDTLVEEGEEMLSLLHSVAAASDKEFPEVQEKCLKFLASVHFDEAE